MDGYLRPLEEVIEIRVPIPVPITVACTLGQHTQFPLWATAAPPASQDDLFGLVQSFRHLIELWKLVIQSLFHINFTTWGSKKPQDCWYPSWRLYRTFIRCVLSTCLPSTLVYHLGKGQRACCWWSRALVE